MYANVLEINPNTKVRRETRVSAILEFGSKRKSAELGRDNVIVFENVRFRPSTRIR